MKLSIRLTLVMVALVAGTTAGMLFFANHVLESAIGAGARRQLETRARLLATMLDDKLGEVSADVLIIPSTTALRRLIVTRHSDATLAGGMDSEAERLASYMKSKLAANASYLAFGIIGIDGGREILRVDRLAPDGSIRTVPNEELQRKDDTDIFKQTIKIKAGDVYISPVRNIQNSAHITALPVLQVATPIYAADGTVFGVVFLSANARLIIDAIHSIQASGTVGEQERVYVVNDRGEYFVNLNLLNQSRELSSASVRPNRLIDLMGDLNDLLEIRQPQSRQLSTLDGQEYDAAIVAAHPEKGARFGAFITVPHAETMAPIASVQKASLIAGMIAVIGAVVLACLLAKSLTKPLVQMTEAIETFKPNQPLKISDAALNASGEIGVLTRAFAHMAEEIKRAAASLQHASEEREHIKDEFVAMVSHELRTPLTSIAASLGLLVADPADKMSAAAKRLLRIAHSNSQRLVRLINDILDIEKIESGKIEFHMRRLDVRRLVEQAIESNRSFADQHEVNVRLDHKAKQGFVQADVDRLTQVVTNLLSNAVKYSPRAGEVLVTIENVDATVRISVRDHGSGIPEKFRSRIFEKFAQADSSDVRQKGGTGLGLNIVKQIVLKLGGKVGFDDAPDGGTIFYVDLPLAADLEAAVDRAIISRGQSQQNTFERNREVA